MQNSQLQENKLKKVTSKKMLLGITPHNKIYECQCGKRYDAFPGLYLHFKRKHNLKISNHPQSPLRKTWENSDCTIITYYYKKNQQGVSNMNKKQRQQIYCKIKMISQQFVKDYECQNIHQQISFVAIDKLCLHLLEQISSTDVVDIEEGKWIKNIPNSFNDFTLKEVERTEMSEKQFEEWRNTLVYFSEWLNKKSYSPLKTVKNIEYSLKH